MKDIDILARAVIKLWYESEITKSEETELRTVIKQAGYHLSEDGLNDIYNLED